MKLCKENSFFFQKQLTDIQIQKIIIVQKIIKNCFSCRVVICSVMGNVTPSHVDNDRLVCRACSCECGFLAHGGASFCNLCGCKCGTCVRSTKKNWSLLLDVLSVVPGSDEIYECCECSSCFPAKARVSLENGKHKTMAELQVGDRVQTG